jgi:putative SOS response-associated peptidase YedK
LWQAESKQELDLETKEFRCVILTTTPSESVGRVHDRMPFRVEPEQYDWWLPARDGRPQEPEYAARMWLEMV